MKIIFFYGAIGVFFLSFFTENRCVKGHLAVRSSSSSSSKDDSSLAKRNRSSAHNYDIVQQRMHEVLKEQAKLMIINVQQLRDHDKKQLGLIHFAHTQELENVRRCQECDVHSKQKLIAGYSIKFLELERQ